MGRELNPSPPQRQADALPTVLATDAVYLIGQLQCKEKLLKLKRKLTREKLRWRLTISIGELLGKLDARQGLVTEVVRIGEEGNSGDGGGSGYGKSHSGKEEKSEDGDSVNGGDRRGQFFYTTMVF